MSLDLRKCKEYEIESGANYRYSDLFQIVSSRQTNTSDTEDDLLLDLNLRVQTAKDAHILLSPTDQISPVAALYEIGMIILHIFFFANKLN